MVNVSLIIFKYVNAEGVDYRVSFGLKFCTKSEPKMIHFLDGQLLVPSHNDTYYDI